MTDLMQQIINLEQQQLMYEYGGLIMLIVGLASLIIGGIWLSLIFDFGTLRAKIISGILIAVGVGLIIIGCIFMAKSYLLGPQIEMLKYQLDGAIPILPMN